MIAWRTIAETPKDPRPRPRPPAGRTPRASAPGPGRFPPGPPAPPLPPPCSARPRGRGIDVPGGRVEDRVAVAIVDRRPDQRDFGGGALIQRVLALPEPRSAPARPVPVHLSLLLRDPRVDGRGPQPTPVAARRGRRPQQLDAGGCRRRWHPPAAGESPRRAPRAPRGSRTPNGRTGIADTAENMRHTYRMAASRPRPVSPDSVGGATCTPVPTGPPGAPDPAVADYSLESGLRQEAHAATPMAGTVMIDLRSRARACPAESMPRGCVGHATGHPSNLVARVPA